MLNMIRPTGTGRGTDAEPAARAHAGIGVRCEPGIARSCSRPCSTSSDLDAAERLLRRGARAWRWTAASRACSASFASAPACCCCSIRRPPRATATCRRTAPPAPAMPASPSPRAELDAWQAAAARARRRDRARAGLAARRPLVLCPRSRRQQPRARDAADLGPARARGRPPHDRRLARARPTMRAALGRGRAAQPARPAPAVRLSPTWSAPGATSRSCGCSAAGRHGAPTLVWHPFLLNPICRRDGVTRTPVSRAQVRQRRPGAMASTAASPQAGAREGIAVRVRRDPRPAQHDRGPRPAAGRGRARRASSRRPRRLFRAFFAEGADIGDAAVLARDRGRARPRAEAIAATPVTARPAIAVGARPRARLRARASPACRCCVFGDDHVIAGAQPAEALAGAARSRALPAATRRRRRAHGRHAS